MISIIKKFAQNNKGTSLIELIVVISILGVLVGTASLGVSLAFSRDASKCATRLNDAVYEVRMATMSKVGTYYLTVRKNSSGEYETVIMNGTQEESVISLSENKRIKDITLEFNGSSKQIDESHPVKLYFDKAKGNVTKVNSADIGIGEGKVSDGIIVFSVTQSRGTRPPETVKIVTATGKHTVGDF